MNNLFGGGHRVKRRIAGGRTWSLAVTLLLLGTTVHARTITINSEGTGDYPTIRAALNAAVSGDTIVLDPGAYFGFGNQDITLVGKALTLRSRDPNDPVVVADTVIDCQADRMSWSTHWVIGAEGGGGTHLTLAGLTLINGLEVGAGGSIRAEEADLDVLNCTFRNNASLMPGGAVRCRNNRARFVGCTFTNNISDVEHGGAVYATGSQLEAVNCSFEGSTGCALETYDCQVTLTNCTFTGNRGRDGGALRCQGDTIPENTSLSLTGCTFTGNTSRTHGGALYLWKTKTAVLRACTFRANEADQDGGAIYCAYASPRVASCLFLGNRATGQGGVMHNLTAGSSAIVNCTLVANTAGQGGVVAAAGGSHPVISQSILWGNVASLGNSVYLGPWAWASPPTALATVRFCDVEGGRRSTFVEPGCELAWDMPSNLDANPLFLAPAAADYRLSPGSPCIDTGDPACQSDPGQTDLDGQARHVGLAIDLGAYEFSVTYPLLLDHGPAGGPYPGSGRGQAPN